MTEAKTVVKSEPKKLTDLDIVSFHIDRFTRDIENYRKSIQELMVLRKILTEKKKELEKEELKHGRSE